MHPLPETKAGILRKSRPGKAARRMTTLKAAILRLLKIALQITIPAGSPKAERIRNRALHLEMRAGIRHKKRAPETATLKGGKAGTLLQSLARLLQACLRRHEAEVRIQTKPFQLTNLNWHHRARKYCRTNPEVLLRRNLDEV